MTENEIPAVEGGDESWNPKILDDLVINNESIPLNTQIKEDRNGYSTNPFLVDDYDNMYTDRNVLECDVPVLEVFYQQDSLVKDICVDMGVPEKEKTVSYTAMTNLESLDSFHGSDEDKQHCHPSIGCNNADMFISDEDTNSRGCETKEANEVKTVDDQGTVQLPSDVSIEKKSHVHCDSCEETTDITVTDSSKIDSPIDKELEGTEFSTQRSLGSLLSHLDDERKETTLLHEQVPIVEKVSESSKATLTRPDEDVEANSNVLYNRKVETESITFNFDSDTTNEAVQTFQRDTKDIQKDTIEDDDKVLHSKEQDTSYNENAHDHQPQPLITTKDVAKSDNLSEAEQAGPGEKHDHGTNFDDEQSPESSSRKSTSDPHLPHRADIVQTTPNKSRSSPFQYDEGETSFSAASLVGFSGSIPHSGSISHRSDGSTTSGKSFAFPVLQSEWNSSPVRMAKADRSHFRKHKGWRSGLLCCRF